MIIITNKGLKYLTLHVMSLYNILVSPFNLKFCTIFSFFEFHLYCPQSNIVICETFIYHYHQETLVFMIVRF